MINKQHYFDPSQLLLKVAAVHAAETSGKYFNYQPQPKAQIELLCQLTWAVKPMVISQYFLYDQDQLKKFFLLIYLYFSNWSNK